MSVELFKKEKLRALKMDGCGEETLEIDYLFSTSLVGTGDVMVALAEVEQPDRNRVILTKYIGTQDDNWGDRAIEGDGKNWKARLFLDKNEHIVFASVARGGSVYVLSASQSMYAPSFKEDGAKGERWDFKLSVGTTVGGGDAAEKNIVWNTKDVSDSSAMKIQKYLYSVSPIGGSAFMTEDGTFVFVLSGNNSRSHKNVFVFAHSKDPNSDLTFCVSGLVKYSGYFFLWGKQLFRFENFYRGARCFTLRVSNDMGMTWGKASGPLKENLNSLDGERFAFTPITIGKRRVLLFAVIPHTDDSSKESEIDCGDYLENNYINVFMADDEHFRKVGRIFVMVKKHGSAGTFLYTNDELFFLYHGRARDQKILFFRLKGQLGRIKLLLEEWYPGDEEHATGPAEPPADVSEEPTNLADKKTSRKTRR